MNVASDTPNRQRRFFGYRTCIQCSYEFYREHESQMMCKLCQVELTHRCGKSNVDFHAPASALRDCAAPWCTARFLPRDMRQKYCSRECSRQVHNERIRS